MLIFAFCRDAASSAALRQTWFAEHSRHVIGLPPRVCVAAPLATADGAKARGDERIRASVFIFDVDSVETAEAILEADPYFQHKVWDRADLYTAPMWFGLWTPDAEEQLKLMASMADGPILAPLPDGKPYFAFCRGAIGADPTVSEEARQAHGRYIAHLSRRLLLGIQLDHVAAMGSGAAEEPWRALYVFQADTMAEGVRFAQEDPFAAQGVWRATVFAAPAVFGPWSAAQSPARA